MKFNWDSIFRDAHLHSWPTAGLTISNAKPGAHKDQGKRHVYKEDEAEITEAAKRYGYRKIFHSENVVLFTHPTLKGVAQ